jgi:hypothetical protein
MSDQHQYGYYAGQECQSSMELPYALPADPKHEKLLREQLARAQQQDSQSQPRAEQTKDKKAPTTSPEQ